MGTSTRQTNVRLGARARGQLAGLCEHMGTSAAGVISIALDRLYTDTIGAYTHAPGSTGTPQATQASPQGHERASTPTGAHRAVHEHERYQGHATSTSTSATTPTPARRSIVATYDPDLD